MKKFILYILILCYSNINAQTKEELITALQQTTNDSMKIEICCQLGDMLIYENPDEALQHLNAAIKLGEEKNYQFSLSKAYHTVGNLFYTYSNYSLALENFQKAFAIRLIIDYKEGLASTSNNMANIYKQLGNYEKALEYNEISLKMNIELNDKKWVAYSYKNIGDVHENKGNYHLALDYFFRAITIFEEIDEKQGLAYCYSSIGNIYKNQGSLDRAIDYYFQSLQISEDISDHKSIATNYNNIGIISAMQGNFDQALDYYFKSLDIKDSITDMAGTSDTYNNIGLVYLEKGRSDTANFTKALEYYTKSLEISLRLGSNVRIASCYNNIGIIYIAKQQYHEALEVYNKSLEIRKLLGEKRGIAYSYNGIGNAYKHLSNFTKAIENYKNGMEIGKEIGSIEIIKISAEGLSEAFSEIKQFEEAFKYQVIFKQMSDSLRNEENTKRITQLSMQYQFDKKLKEQELLQQRLDIENDEKLRRQKIYLSIAISGLIVMGLFAFVIFRGYRIKQRHNRLLAIQKAEISEKNLRLETQNEEITKQNKEIERKNQDITASINYARRIQNAILPPPEMFSNVFSDYFIFFKPRDIVSGDYYWIKEVENHVIVTVADCTGHGVPGAFMSMLGIAFLNEIVNKIVEEKGIQYLQAGKILTDLRELVKKSLRQTGKDNEAKDGMDMSLFVLDRNKKILQFAGAYNSIYIVRNGELIQIKADRMPIGIFINEKPEFTNTIFELQMGDTIYMFSDGYVDQFGGDDGRKFRVKPFKELILEIHHLPLQQQYRKFIEVLDEWKGLHEQVDDILVLGIKIQ